MPKVFYTTAKNGDTVEVDHELAKSLIASGKKKPEDFMVSGSDDTASLPEATEADTVQGGVVFMNPTSEEKATKYARENAEQDTYKVDALAGRSAVGTYNDELTDPTNPKFRRLASEAYGDIRNLLSYPMAAVTNLAARANEPEVVDGKQTNKGEGYWAGYARNYPATVQEGKEGKGVTGFLADPINYAPMLIPGVGEALAATKLGTRFAQTARGIGAGIEGAGYTAASEALDPTKTFEVTDPKSSAIDNVAHYGLAAVLGGALGAGGEYMRNAGRESFPGIMSRTSTAITKDARTNLEANLDDILSRGVIPKNRAGFRIMADNETAKLGREYDKGIEAATPLSFHDLSGNHTNIESPTAAYHQYDVLNTEGLDNAQLPLLTPLSKVKQEVEGIYKDKLAKGDLLSDKNLNKLDKSIERARASAVHRQKLEQYAKDEAHDLTVLQDPHDNPFRSIEILDKLTNDPVYEARDLSALRNNMMNPNMYKKIDKGAGGLADRDLSVSYRDAINDILEADPRYAASVTPNVKANYALYKSLGAVVDKPGAIGLANRLPWGQSVDPWRSASLKYKMGGLIDQMRKAIPYGSNTIRNTIDAYRASQSDTTSGY